MDTVLDHATVISLNQASDLLDLFWTWVAEAEREQLLRKQKSDEMELVSTVGWLRAISN